jgi:hypothetical protein
MGSYNVCTVTEKKLFAFLFYQAYRNERKRGRKKTRVQDEDFFDFDDYHTIMSKVESPETFTDDMVDQDFRPIAHDQVNQYLCSVLDVHKQQVDMDANNLSKHQLRSDRVMRLMNVVKKRKKKIEKENFEEKLESEFSPYMLVKDIPRIELNLFDNNKTSSFYCQGSLRDRFCFLMTFCGILRGESLFKCELSDLCDIVIEEGVLAKHHILVMRIATGQTNGLKTLYGRVLRHRQVELCPIGALGFYLMSRFHLADEKVDFSSNQSWFNVKLLVECGSKTPEVSVSDQTYAKNMKGICKELGIVSKHYIHFGRAVGAVSAELSELDSLSIKQLGNWNPDTQEDRYSSKLPLKAMRIMGGHEENKNLMFLPRAEITPPESLVRQIFPFLEEEMKKDNFLKRPTTLAFLNMLKRLRVVILQDVAVLKNMGRTHKFFEAPVFCSNEFENFRKSVSEVVASAMDTSDANVEKVLPGLMKRLDIMHSDMKGLLNIMKGYIQEVSTQVKRTATSSQLQQFVNHIGSFKFELENQDSETKNEIENVPIKTPKNNEFSYRIFQGHTSVTSMWNEWFGIEEFRATENNLCFPGGIEVLESKKEKGKNWRGGFSCAEQKYFSRLKYIIKCVKEKIDAGYSIEEALHEFDQLMKTKKSISSLEAYLKRV